MTDIDKLYYLVYEYHKGNYKTHIFAELFTVQYNHDTDYQNLSEFEHIQFRELCEIVDRYSQFEDDFINCPNVYYCAEEVMSKTVEVVAMLDKYKRDNLK